MHPRSVLAEPHKFILIVDALGIGPHTARDCDGGKGAAVPVKASGVTAAIIDADYMSLVIDSEGLGILRTWAVQGGKGIGGRRHYSHAPQQTQSCRYSLHESNHPVLPFHGYRADTSNSDTWTVESDHSRSAGGTGEMFWLDGTLVGFA